MTLNFDNSYARLPADFFTPQQPDPVPEPKLVALNRDLAARLGLDCDWLESPEGVEMLAGNQMPAGAEPIAQVYAGHQFGGFVPRLGDGRAVLLGEVVAPDGAHFDLVLKGAGRTAYSRGRSDGRAWIGPVLREYVLSEAMAALGLPTTRALAAVTTGASVSRDGWGRPGAVFARVAASHIRIGTFQYFAARGDIDALETLCNYSISRHFPDAEGPLGLLRAVVAAQGELIAGWMSFGFVHGVMNTDNMAISGETIDYGPCAFLDAYHPQKVFSSIDQFGRYAFGQQAQIAIWNLAQLANCLLPLMGEKDAAIEAASAAVDSFIPIYQAAWLKRFGTKIGLADAGEDDLPLIHSLLERMATEQADFTRVFSALRSNPDAARIEFTESMAFDQWAEGWRARLQREADPEAVMARANPMRIARNHQVEAMIEAALAQDYAPFHRLNAALADPFAPDARFLKYETAPRPNERVSRTFCGT
ncbi:YdiU family protein [Thioclava sp. 15-R06ZXC-3]|uniref:Protein nucleotidyltransferase YdiU n=1 Tax=Thioclava arctica TaxID=3238301 RepID=A0ABV3TMQ4_9RHOB